MKAHNQTQLTDFGLNSLEMFKNNVYKTLQKVRLLHGAAPCEQTVLPTCSACVSIIASSSSFTHSSSAGGLTGFGVRIWAGFKVQGVPDLRGGTNVFFTQGETVEFRGES